MDMTMKESMMRSLASACIQMNEINYVHFANQKLLSPFAPTWDYFIAEKLISNIQYTRLKNYLLRKQQEIFSIKDNLAGFLSVITDVFEFIKCVCPIAYERADWNPVSSPIVLLKND